MDLALRLGFWINVDRTFDMFEYYPHRGPWRGQIPALGTRSLTMEGTQSPVSWRYYFDGALMMDILIYNHEYESAIPYWPAAYLARRLGFTTHWDAETNTTMLTSTANSPSNPGAVVPILAAPVITVTLGKD